MLICGASPAGLLFTQYLRNVLGFQGFLVVADPHEHKRQLAKTFGADEAVDSREDLVETVREYTSGKGRRR